MPYDKALIAGKLRRWEKYLDSYRLPMWDEIPDFGLYMEQVISLLKDYLDYMPPELKEAQFITPATINNYVRKRIMPEPVRKKYYRTHIAFLIMICSRKQCISIPTLQTMRPVGMSEEELKLMDDVREAYISRTKIGCTGCRYCMPCPNGVDIPGVFAVWNSSALYNADPKENFGMKMILKNGATPDKCVACGACEAACPQHLSIIGELQRAWEEMMG